MKNMKKSKKEEMNKKKRKYEKEKARKKTKKLQKKSRKKGKEGPKGYHPRWAHKLIFHIRIVKRNRNEIDAPKKSDFEQPTKTKKVKEHERK